MSAARAPFTLLALLRWLPLLLLLTVIAASALVVTNVLQHPAAGYSLESPALSTDASGSASFLVDGFALVVGSGVLFQIGAAAVFGALLMAVAMRLRQSAPVALVEGAGKVAGAGPGLLSLLPLGLSSLGLVLIATGAMLTLTPADAAAQPSVLAPGSLQVSLVVVGIALAAGTVIGIVARAGWLRSMVGLMLPVAVVAAWVALQAGTSWTALMAVAP